MDQVVVDSDVVSYMYRRDPRAREFRPYLIGQRLFISFMTLAELNLWPRRNHWGNSRREQLRVFLQRYHVYHSDESLCERWSAVVAQMRAIGRPIELGDAWIAATALDLGVPLVTNNATDFAHVEGLELLFPGYRSEQ